MDDGMSTKYLPKVDCMMYYEYSYKYGVLQTCSPPNQLKNLNNLKNTAASSVPDPPVKPRLPRALALVLTPLPRVRSWRRGIIASSLGRLIRTPSSC